MANILSAVFTDAQDAQRAVDWLRDGGVPASAISLVARRSDDAHASDDGLDEYGEEVDEAAEAGRGALTGAGVGAGVGALFGLAAAAIPGVGPFITAGSLANTFLGAAGGGAAAGAIVGGTSGALAGALTNWGLNEAESGYYAGEIESGGTYVGVDLSQTTMSRETAMDAFRRFNGRFSA